MASTAVSIVTPAFNAARFIIETMASVRAQSCTEWEMLVVDDCSRDRTREIVAEAAAQESRLRLIVHGQNAGPAAARNTAIAAARGRFIAFLDADDLWLPGKLERQLAFMTKRASVFSFTSYRRINETGTLSGRLIPIPSRLNYQGLLKNTAIVTSSVMIDRERSGPIAMRQTYYDDFVLWLELLRGGANADGLQEDLMRYRVVKRSVSRDKATSAKWVWRTYRDIEHLGRAASLWCFSHYAWNAMLKYSRF